MINAMSKKGPLLEWGAFVLATSLAQSQMINGLLGDVLPIGRIRLRKSDKKCVLG